MSDPVSRQESQVPGKQRCLDSPSAPVCRGAGVEEVLICAGDLFREEDLLELVTESPARIEPEAARAIARCLQGGVQRLLIDLTLLGAWPLCALGQLRLLRPGLEIVLLHEAGQEPAHLAGTLLEGLRIIRLRASFPDAR